MQTQPEASVWMSSGARSIIYEDARQRTHIEACGILLGKIDEQGPCGISTIRQSTLNSPLKTC
jgi:proteasome lid subunit RPN8/RPN11